MDQTKAFQTATLLDGRDGTYVATTASLVPFKAPAEQWFAAPLQLERRTQITYWSAIDHNLAPLHDKPVGKTTHGDVEAIVTAMTAAGHRHSTVRNVLNALSADRQRPDSRAGPGACGRTAAAVAGVDRGGLGPARTS